MIPAANLLAFVLVATPLILAPGPSVLFIIGRSLSLGRVGGLLSVAGNALGALVVVVAVAFGVGILIAQSIVIFTIVKVVGAAYLIYLGVQAIRHRKATSTTAATTAPRAKGRILLEAFFVGVTNPKTFVFFIAVLPQFIDYAAPSIPVQMLELGGIFLLMALACDSAWALAAGIARDWFARSPRRISTLGAAGGVMMIGLGVGSLFVGQGKD